MYNTEEGHNTPLLNNIGSHKLFSCQLTPSISNIMLMTINEGQTEIHQRSCFQISKKKFQSYLDKPSETLRKIHFLFSKSSKEFLNPTSIIHTERIINFYTSSF